MLGVTFSRRLAILGGLLLPVLETARRWRQWPGPIQTWPLWMDDYLLDAFLLSAAWLSRPRVVERGGHFRRLSWLTAAWGFGCGLGFGSLIAQFNHLIDPSLGDDPSGVAHQWMVLIKAILVVIGAVGLLTSMRDEAEAR